MNKNLEHTIWAERYRPTQLEDLIFPKKLRSKVQEWIDKGEIPHIGIFGSVPGTGKSSLLSVLIESLQTDTLWINGSKDNGIDMIRGEISGFAGNVAVTGNIKLICIDEADYLTIPAQSTLRSDLELYAKNARFAFTGNHPDKIIPPLKQRLQVFDLDKIFQENKKELGSQIFSRLTSILDEEGVQYDKKDVISVVKTFYPSTREMLMFLEKSTVDNKLDVSDLSRIDDVFGELVDAMKERKFKSVRSAVDDIMIPDNFYSWLYKNMDDIFHISSQPQIIMLLAEHQDLSSRATNKQIPLISMLVNIIGDPDVKFI